jgi:acyl carrier protein
MPAEDKMKTTLQISLSEARLRIREVRQIVAEHSGIDEGQIKLRSALNNDLGIDGQDSWELLEACEKQYGIKGDNFNLTDFFSNTEPPSDPLIQIFVHFPYALFGMIFIRPFSKSTWQAMQRRFQKQDFTFGDLVVWTITKDFALRNRLNIEFKKDPLPP